eukprot:1214934-Amphidinium_carterae.1
MPSPVQSSRVITVTFAKKVGDYFLRGLPLPLPKQVLGNYSGNNCRGHSVHVSLHAAVIVLGVQDHGRSQNNARQKAG